MPVVFLPIPPDFLERPRRAMERPTRGFFSQIAQVCMKPLFLNQIWEYFAEASVVERKNGQDEQSAYYIYEMKLGKPFFLRYTQPQLGKNEVLSEGHMLFKSRKSKAVNKFRKVKFEYYAPQATKVGVGGTFNGWDAEKSLMKRQNNGQWRVEMDLLPGRYEYRYFIDGSWQNDQRPVECVPNAFGTWNCVLEVS